MTRHLLLLLPLATLTACGDKADEDDSDVVDADGDGFDEDADCDDGNNTINPDADEVCDGIDNNCDGEIDEGSAIDASTFYTDADGDGFGDAAVDTTACSEPAGFVADDTDCDDEDAAVNPDADELCATEGIDDDCDGDIDEDDAADASGWYTDSDGDGYGPDDSWDEGCTPPDDAVDEGGDCVDDQSSISPMAAEICDGIDNDCDDEIDEDDATDAPTWYTDADHDGYGDDSTAAQACEAVEWQVEDNTDCDDTEPTVFPGADPICDDLDNDCDGTVDGGWRVPSDYSDIQSAIDAATGGETVCVEAGTYTETIDFSGKDIVLVGTAGSEDTVIDGDGSGPVVTFANDEGAGSELSGFTITGGDASYGAGVYMSGASPTLVDLVIEDNACGVDDCRGTGVYVDGGSPTFLQVDLVDNVIEGGFFSWGAGAYLEGASASIQGMRATGNTISDAVYAYGGAISLRDATAVDLSNVEILGNLAEDSSYVAGVGVYMYGSTGITMSNVIIAGNSAAGEYVWGPGLYTQVGDATLENGVVHGNESAATTESYGPGVSVGSQAELTMRNTSVTANTDTSTGDSDGVGGLQVSGDLDISYCNVYGNSVAEFSGIEDPTGADGNISTDPGYTDVSSADPLDWDFTLDTGSDLIDAGDPSLTDPDGSTSDIGAYGGEGAADWGWAPSVEELRTGEVSEGYVVTVSGVVVTAVTSSGFYVQDTSAAAPEYSGIYIYQGDTPAVARGMEFTVTGELYDYFGEAELIVDDAASDLVVTGTPGEPEPLELTLAEAIDEAYEGVLVHITDGTLDDAAYDCSVDGSSCSDSDLWTLTDGTDVLILWDRSYESDDWTDQVGVSPVTGVMAERYSRYRLMPRSSWDF